MKKFTVLLIGMLAVSVLSLGQSAYHQNKLKQTNDLKGHLKNVNDLTRSSVLFEDFETWPPADWTIIDGENSQGTQHWNQFDSETAGFDNVARILYDDDGDATARPQDEWMVSPEFTVPETPILRFYINTSTYWFIDPYDNADINVNISTDDGATWTTLLNEHDIVDLETYVWKEVIISLADYIGQNVKIAFQYVGQDAAQCSIDNVEVFTKPMYDIQLNDVAINFNQVDETYPTGGNYHVSGHFARIPRSVLEEENTIMLFNAVVNNFGQNEADVICSVKIVDPEEQEVYNQSVTLNEMASDATDTLNIGWTDETLFSMNEYKLGDYKVIFDISIDGQDEDILSNNTDTVIVEATNNIYSRALGRSVDGNISPTLWTNGAPGDEVHVSYDMMFPSSYEIDETVEIKSVDLFIHELSAIDYSFNANIAYYNGDAGEFVVLGTTPIYSITESDLGSLVNLTFEDPVFITKNDANYVQIRLAVAVYDDPDNSDYVRFATEEVPTAGWSTQWVINGSSFGAEPWTISNFTDEVPIFSINTDFPASIQAENAWNDFMIYPNPVQGVLTIENVKDAKIEIFNMLGMRISTINNADFKTQINLSNYSEGTYIVRVTSDKGVGTRKINIVK